MTTRQDLLTHWNEQLTIAEEAELATVTWRQRIRKRLYRFLLAMYGQAAWSGSPEAADEVTEHPVALLVSDEVDLPAADEDGNRTAGKAPRTRAEILRGLKNVRGLSDELAPAGPLQSGLPPIAPVAVASCKKRPRAIRLMCQLTGAGFSPTLVRRAELYQIFVMAADAPTAVQFLAWVAQEPVQPSKSTIPAFQTRRDVWQPSANLVWSVCCGVIGIILTFYVYSLIYQHAIDPQNHPLPTPDRFSVLVAATGIIDVLAGFLLWLSWRETFPRARTNEKGPDSPAD